MEGDGDCLQRLEEITFELIDVVAKIKHNKLKEDQFFSNVRSEGKIIYFPNYFAKNGNILQPEESDEPEEQQEETKNEDNEAFLEFTEKEMKKMPKTFRNEFKAGKIKARVRKCKNKYYEIRVQLDKVRITASSVNLETAKERFIEKLNEYENAKHALKTRNVLFGDYLVKWLDTVKKPYVKQDTYKFYNQTIKADILPQFGKRIITDITQTDLQKFFNTYTEQGKNRTAKKIMQILKPLFAYAISDGLIQRSPIDKVIIGTYEQEHGSALTRDEERDFIRSFTSDPQNAYKQAFAFILYTGLRRSELASVVIDESWVTVVSAKQRKGRKEKSRRIPISPMLRKVLPLINVEKIKKLNIDGMTREFKKAVDNHHLHDLRHTFITRCQECGIARELVSVWAGHSTDKSITATVYTHLEQFEARQIAEISKFTYDFS
jgi:integrase